MTDHPVCGAKVGFAKIILMPQPPLLTRRGLPNYGTEGSEPLFYLNLTLSMMSSKTLLYRLNSFCGATPTK